VLDDGAGGIGWAAPEAQVTGPGPAGQVVLYRSEDGRTKLDVLLEGETVWLSQRQLTELFGKAKGTISEHIKHIFEDGELDPAATVRRFRTVQREGSRDVTREVELYNLDMVIALGFAVNPCRVLYVSAVSPLARQPATRWRHFVAVSDSCFALSWLRSPTTKRPIRAGCRVGFGARPGSKTRLSRGLSVGEPPREGRKKGETRV
jgi:hypothetical protein